MRIDQSRFTCRLEWGRSGARRAGERGDVVVIVDALSFSTAVAFGVAEGLSVMPCTDDDDLHALAREHGAQPAARRELADGGLSLSPLSLTGIGIGTRVLLRSPNGATCARRAAEAGAHAVFAAAFVNAAATARAVARAASDEHAVTVCCCGERWPEGGGDDDEDGPVRFALEDELAAGCLVTRLREAVAGAAEEPRWASAEARVAEHAWRSVEADGGDQVLRGLMRDALSGLELRLRGSAADVEVAARIDALDVAPRLARGWFGADDGR